MSAIDTEEQSKYSPERLRGLTPYKAGQTGNPGGIKRGRRDRRWSANRTRPPQFESAYNLRHTTK